jgi:hypothetical protein
MCLYTPQINEQPVIFNSSHVNELERLYEKYVNEELNQLEEMEVNFFLKTKIRCLIFLSFIWKEY